jgi:hypothetical protein
MVEILSRYDLPPDTLIIEPILDHDAKSAHGKIIVREMIDPDKSLPWGITDDSRVQLLSDPKKVISCLLLHEIYHTKYHHRNVNDLTTIELLANELEADEFVKEEMQL